MKTINVDVAIIGAGSAGLNARREAEKAGQSWVLIDGGPLGTTCARVGCMPSKLLIAAAEAAHEVGKAHKFGIHVDLDTLEVDAEEVFDRVRRERDRFVGFVVSDIEALGEKLLRGYARFADETTLIVDNHTTVEAEAVVIATGSTPFVPPILEDFMEDERVMTSADIFDLHEVPPRLAVIGAGVIGMELGQALGRLGSNVTCFDISERIGFFSDDAVNDTAREAFSEEMTLHLGVPPEKVEATDEGIAITFVPSGDDEAVTEVFSHLLVSAGRRPNVRGMGLEDLDLPRDEADHIISHECSMQIGETPIFIAGDAANHRPILHEASDEGRIAGHNASNYPDVNVAFRRAPMGVAFTSPQMGYVGKRWEELDADEVVVGEVSYANQGRARVMLRNQGLVRLYANKRDCVLVGGELCGPDVEHTAHLLAWAIQQRLRVPEILRFPFYHPVVEEGIRTALRDLAKQLKVVSHCPPEDFALSPGL